MVMPEILAVTPEGTPKTSTALFPLTARVVGPGPMIVRFVLSSMVLLSTMGALEGQETEKVMVSPEAAPATTAGSDPGPEPEQVVTVSVAAPAIDPGSTAIESAAVPTRRMEAATRRQSEETW
jgi:hypothetical protein